VCPGDTSSQTAQLAAQLANMMRDLKGEPAAYEGAEAKAGLIERAGTLLGGLKNKVR
jgi:hypothetical protein